MKKISCFALYLFFALQFLSCKKESDPQPLLSDSASVPKGILKLHLHTFIGQSEVDNYNLNYTDEKGRNISLSLAQLYISDIKLIRLDGSQCSIADRNILKFFESETSTVGEVPVGNYKSISFKLGLNFGAISDSSVLKEPSMWFTNSNDPNKYIAFNFQGKIDTSSNLSGLMAPFCYKIASNTENVSITMSNRNFTVLKDQIQYIHMLIDYSQIFNGIQLNNSSNLNISNYEDNTSDLAINIKKNFPLMFKYE